MTFEAYIRNIEAKTGKTLRELHSLASTAGVLHGIPSKTSGASCPRPIR